MNIKKLLALIAENWPAKAVSLALAVGLYIFHSMSTLEERLFSVPLSIESSGNLIPSKSYPRVVRISLRGNANTLYPIVEGDIETYIDLDRYEVPGDYRAEILIRKKGSALSTDALEIRVEPADIELSLDYRISKSVPVEVNLRGNVESGYELNYYSLNPARVIIDGPSGLISGIAELYTEFVDIEGRSGDFDATLNILNRDPFITIRGGNSTDFHGQISIIGAVVENDLLEEEDLEDDDSMGEGVLLGEDDTLPDEKVLDEEGAE